MRARQLIDKLDRIIVKGISALSAATLTIIFIVMLAQVFLRRIFNSPIIWAEDLAVFLFIWITFLGAVVLFQKKTLSSVDSLVMLFPKKIQIIIEACMDLIVSVSSLYLLNLSYQFMKRQQSLGHKLGGALGIPIWVVTTALILSFALIILFGITSFVKNALLVHERMKGVSS